MKAFLRRRTWIAMLFVLAGFVVFARHAGQILVVDAPEPSDVIIVLAGETDSRPAHALELLNQGLAPRVVIDVPAETKVYDTMQIELAKRYRSEERRVGKECRCRWWPCREKEREGEEERGEG